MCAELGDGDVVDFRILCRTGQQPNELRIASDDVDLGDCIDHGPISIREREDDVAPAGGGNAFVERRGIDDHGADGGALVPDSADPIPTRDANGDYSVGFRVPTVVASGRV